MITMWKKFIEILLITARQILELWPKSKKKKKGRARGNNYNPSFSIINRSSLVSNYELNKLKDKKNCVQNEAKENEIRETKRERERERERESIYVSVCEIKKLKGLMSLFLMN